MRNSSVSTFTVLHLYDIEPVSKMIKNSGKHTAIKNLKQLYEKEYEFISDLLSKVNLPTQPSESSDSDENTTKDDKVKHQERVIRLKNTERAKSLEELHNRIAALRELKYTYKGKKLKNKLQRKLKRKKKIYENKNKPNKSAKENEHESVSESNHIETKLPKPIFNSEGNLVFSKFDLLGETSSVVDKSLLVKEKGNPKKMLENYEKNQNFIKKLEESGDVEKAHAIKEEMTWKNMFRKAEGLKVKDDPVLLKKSLKKIQSQKKQSERKWKERIKTVEKQKADKQKKRTENINKRLQERKKNRLKKASKKGRFIPNI